VGGSELIATARIIRAGKRIVVCEATVTQDERKLAIGLFTYMRFTPARVE
jgi:acyl-coenzyme A thioesterase PaaI-like protein